LSASPGRPGGTLLRVKRTVLDHVAIGTRVLSDGWELFGGLLGGTWGYGGDSPGYWWGQLLFASGPKIELLTPTGGPDSAFLERFLAARGAGPHHFNFSVGDIGATLDRVRELGIEPVGVELSNPQWKEAFLHPKTAHGIVIQVAQAAGPGPRPPAPADLPAPGGPSAFTLVEHHVADLDGATVLFTQALDGEIASRNADAVELTWDNDVRLRLVRSAAHPIGGLGDLHFRRDDGALPPADMSRLADLSARLGISLRLSVR
jgi:methylmalonyl-CoA/ethylmalonyl-CoA epimerase